MNDSAPDAVASSPPRLKRGLVLIACSAAMFMVAVESTIISTAMPTIVASLGSFALFSWVFAVYLLTQAVTTPIYGRLADLYGRKWVLGAGAVVFLVGTTLCSLAQSMSELILYRALQGLGAGALAPVAFTIIGDIYAPAERARVQGYLNMIWGVAAVTGPLLGAFLTRTLGWPSVFWVNLPVGALSLGLLLVFFHDVPHHERRRVDAVGAVLLMVGMSALLLTLIQSSHLSWSLIVALLALAAAALAALERYERRVADPILPLELWRNPVIAATSLGAMAIGAVMMATNVFVPMYVQGLMGRTPIVAGFALTSQSIAWTFTGAFAGWAAAHRSYRELSVWGGLCFVVGALFFVTLAPERGPLWAAAGASLIGFGMGFCNTIYLVAAQDSVAYQQRGIATSGFIFMRMAGQSVGTALLGGSLNLGLAGAASETIDRLMEPTLRAGLAPVEIAGLVGAAAEALGHVFLLTLALAVLALMLAFRLPAGHGAGSPAK